MVKRNARLKDSGRPRVGGWKETDKRGGERHAAKVKPRNVKKREKQGRAKRDGGARAAVYSDVINSIPSLFARARGRYETGDYGLTRRESEAKRAV